MPKVYEKIHVVEGGRHNTEKAPFLSFLPFGTEPRPAFPHFGGTLHEGCQKGGEAPLETESILRGELSHSCPTYCGSWVASKADTEGALLGLACCRRPGTALSCLEYIR